MTSLRGATVSFMDHSSAILDSKSQNSLLDSNQVTSRECWNGSLEQISCFCVSPHRPSRATLATTVIKGIDRSIGWHRPLKMASTVYDPEICVGAAAMHDLRVIQGPNVTRGAREKIAFFAFHAFVVEDSRFQQNRVRTKLYNCGACVF